MGRKGTMAAMMAVVGWYAWACGSSPAIQPATCDNHAACNDGQWCVDGFCAPDGEGVVTHLRSTRATLVLDRTRGSLNIYRNRDLKPVLREGYAGVMLEATDEEGTACLTTDAAVRSVQVGDHDDAVGAGREVVLTVAAHDACPRLEWRIASHEGHSFFTFQVTLTNTGGNAVNLAKAMALTTRASHGGGLFIGADPARHRILEDGSYTFVDHYADLRMGDCQPDDFLSLAIPGNFEGASVSNWNQAVLDLDSGASFVAGVLTFDTSSALVNLGHGEETPPLWGGRTGFAYFSLEAAYNPHPKAVSAGASQTSERYLVDPDPGDPFAALESWALAVQAHNHIVLWTQRGEGHRVPNGWNSWSGSGGTGGYGTGIDEDIILANLEVMAGQFKDFGFDWFQVDDGYMPTYGDWWWKEDKFPHGARWLTDTIRSKGLKPGLWMAPFTMYDNSETCQEHPDWIADKTQVGKLLAGSYNLLDLTDPAVRNWLHQTFHTLRNDWGFDWLKMDFAYWALLGDNFYDSSQTREEAYRGALDIIREELGDDAFFLGVAALGAHMGKVDAVRITLDNMPVWEREPSQSAEAKATHQGFKPTVRTAARRWYLQNRVWINHSDLILFRSNTRDESWPRITFEETRAFCTYVALTGGIVKMGDRLVDLTPQQVNVVRTLTPIYGHSARPLDVFTREFPETWLLTVDEPEGDLPPYHVLGLFNWGSNEDYTTNPATPVADGQTRRFDLALTDLGLKAGTDYLAYEFWTQTFLGVVQDRLRFDLEGHEGRLISLRKTTDTPQFVGFNRHALMGAVLVKESRYDEGTRRMTFRFHAAKGSDTAPFPYHLAFWLPAGYTLSQASSTGVVVDGITTAFDAATGLLTLDFSPAETGELAITLQF